MTSFDYSGVMWAEATRDREAEETQELQLRGKLATASFWPFLAAAESETDFGHRLVLIEDRIAAVVAPPVLDSVLASVASDWKLLHTARLEARVQGEQERLRQAEAHRAAQPQQVRPDDEIFDVSQGRWVRVSYIDPSDAQRYSHYPNMNPPVDNGPLQGPDGFVTGGEGDAGRSDAVIQQRQLTPGQWTVTPGTEWPVRPNAADPTQVPRTAAKQVIGGRRQAVSRETLEDIERRDPDAGERQPTQADYDAHRAWAVGKHGPEAWERYRQGGWDLPDSHASRSQVPRTAAGFGANGHPTPLQAVVKGHFIRHGDGWHEVVHILDDDDDSTTLTLANGAKVRSSSGEQVQMMSPREHQIHHSSRRQAGEGIAPTPGPNPNYFSQGSEGIAGPPTFPENPSSAIEPKTDNRMDDLYGAVPPQVSPGSAQGLVDGQDYSRQVPGSSATAAHQASDNPAKQKCKNCNGEDVIYPIGQRSNSRDCPNCGGSGWTNKTQASRRRPFDRTAGGFGGSEPTFKPGDRVQSFRGEGATVHRVHPSQESGKSHRVQVRWDDPERNLTWDGQEHPEGAGDQQAYYEHAFSHHPDTVGGIGHMVDQAVPHSQDIQRAYSSKQAGTNGRIVGHCDHCSQPVRYHTGENGVDELRHLHNNHNDCSNGQKAASLRRSTAFFDPKDASVRVLADGMSRTRPTLDNPSGAGDEYDANTWNNAVTQRPMQSAEDRGINTPTQPRDPIGTVSSEPGRGDDDDRNQNGMARETSLAGHSIEELMES